MRITLLKPKSLTVLWCLIVQLFCLGCQLFGQPLVSGDRKVSEPTATGNVTTGGKQPLFLRIVRDEGNYLEAMETAITQYVRRLPNGKSIHVDLVGAVHVADREYFDKLNQLFTKYDALLYELVAPASARIPKGESRESSGVSMLQSGLVDLLDLDFQLECIDYTKKNFVHADMSPKEFTKSMADRGESVAQLVFQIIAEAAANPNPSVHGPTDIDLLAAFFAPDRAMRLKRILAEQFQNMESMITVLQGPKGSTLLTERNAKALQVMEREIRGGKNKLGIFYGVAHLAHLHQCLTQELGFELRSQSWLVAWKLQAADE